MKNPMLLVASRYTASIMHVQTIYPFLRRFWARESRINQKKPFQTKSKCMYVPLSCSILLYCVCNNIFHILHLTSRQ